MVILTIRETNFFWRKMKSSEIKKEQTPEELAKSVASELKDDAEALQEYCEKQANDIIDMVEEAIIEAHPSLRKRMKYYHGHTLLYGEDYYDLEGEIAERVKKIHQWFYEPDKLP
jgi:hypothetical protein